jgi:hypothetical protein
MSRDTWLLLGALLVGCTLTGVQRILVPDVKWWNLLLVALLFLLLALRRWCDRQE